MTKNKLFIQPKSGAAIKQKIIIILFGIFLCLSMLEIGLRLAGFILSTARETKNRVSMRQKGAYRIMCLGESTTFNQYPGFLEEALNRRGNGIKFSVVDKGVPGIDTSGIISGLEINIEAYRPDMVIVMMGINDDNEYLYHKRIDNQKMRDGLSSFQVYKLGKLIMLHCFAKLNEKKTHVQYDALANNIVPWVSQNQIPLYEINNDIELGKARLAEGDYFMAEEMFKKVLTIEPSNLNAIKFLAMTYNMMKSEAMASEVLKSGAESILKEIEKTSGKQRTELINNYYHIGADYLHRGDFNYASEIFKTVLKTNPRCGEAYLGLANIAFFKNNYDEADAFINKGIEIYNDSMAMYSMRAFLSYELKKYKIAERYMEKASALNSDPYAITAKQNYKKLKALLDKKGIRLVCMQYPMRSIKPLKDIFELDDDILFIDNEIVFKEAVLKSSYKEYFRDIFGGDFGHCTDKGNRLLAENAANVILRAIQDVRVNSID